MTKIYVICRIIKDKYCGFSLPIKAVFWFTICGFIQKSVSVIAVPIFTRLMSTSQYGTVNIFNSWSSIMMLLITLNFHMGVINNAFLKFKNKEKVVSSFQGLVTILCLFALLIVCIFRSFFVSLTNLPFIIIFFMVLSFVFVSSTEYWLILKRYQYKYNSAIKVILTKLFSMTILGLIFVFFFQEKGYARIASIIIIDILYGLLIYINNFRKEKCFYSKEIWLYALSFNLPLIPHFLSQIILNQSDRIMIGNLCGSAFTAIYSIAYSIVSLVFLFTEAIQSSFVPWQYQQLKEKKYKEMNSVSIIILLFICGLLLLLIIFAPEAMMIMGGKEYYEGVFLIPVLSAGIFFNYLQQLFVRVELFYEKKKITVLASIMCASLNILFNYFCIKIFGYQAAAYVTLICYIVMCIFHYVAYNTICNKIIKKKIYDIYSIIGISLLVLFCSFIVLLLYEHIIARILLFSLLVLLIIIKRKVIIKYFKIIKSK